MAEDNKSSGLFWLAILVFGCGAAWAINNYIVAPKKDTTKDNSGVSNQSDGNNNNNQSSTDGVSTKPTIVKDYTTKTQQQAFTPPEYLSYTDPSLDYKLYYIRNWLYLNQNDIMTELNKLYWGQGKLNWFDFNKMNNQDGFDYFVGKKDSTTNIADVTPFTIPNNLTQQQIDDILIQDLEDVYNLSLNASKDFLSNIRKNKGFDIVGYVKDNK